MKQLSVFVLLAVFLYQLVGVYPVALWRQHEFRRVAESKRRAALPDAALVRVAVAGPAQVTELAWHEEHEFSYRGHLFDVVRQQVRADSTIYFCWPDKGEEHLLAGLAEHVREFAHPDAGTRKSAQKMLDYLAKLYVLPAAEGLQAIFWSNAGRPVYRAFAVVPCSRPATAPFAPPRGRG
ncbi:hypothetical protein GCM10027594_21440 [Hymenobacter agri]